MRTQWSKTDQEGSLLTHAVRRDPIECMDLTWSSAEEARHVFTTSLSSWRCKATRFFQRAEDLCITEIESHKSASDESKGVEILVNTKVQ